jgi:TIR domain-containing protein
MALPIFLSYAREDRECALKLANDLSADGVAVWIDSVNIRTGEAWDQAIERALTDCSDMLIVLSPDAVNSKAAMDEISFALDEGKRVLPVLYRVCKVPLRIARVQYADFTNSYAAGVATISSR